MDQQQLISTCEGIQKLYNARKAGIEQQLADRETVAQKARDIRDRIRNEEDPETIRFLERERNDTVARLSEIDRKIGTASQQLQDLENDYRLNQCEVLIGSIG